jgi:DNA-directed RNA polymerase subunit RPC12/RpoP
LGVAVKGFVAEETFANAAGIGPWLQQAIAHFYLDSAYARTLDEKVRQLAAQRLFRSPTASHSVRCPHCGAPNAAARQMEEQFAFICSHCGAPVAVEPREVLAAGLIER